MPSRYPGTMTQDWDTVVLRKAQPKTQDLRLRMPSTRPCDRASRSVKKSNVGTNRKPPATAVSAQKLDEAEDPVVQRWVSAESRHAIQKARSERKMSQAELAKQISESTRLVQEYENGKAVPNQAVLAKMEKVLGVKLRGKINK